jgi:hypothetical protein
MDSKSDSLGSLDNLLVPALTDEDKVQHRLGGINIIIIPSMIDIAHDEPPIALNIIAMIWPLWTMTVVAVNIIVIVIIIIIISEKANHLWVLYFLWKRHEEGES